MNGVEIPQLQSDPPLSESDSEWKRQRNGNNERDKLTQGLAKLTTDKKRVGVQE